MVLPSITIILQMMSEMVDLLLVRKLNCTQIAKAMPITKFRVEPVIVS